MIELIKSEARTARKDHHDDSSEFIIESIDFFREGMLSGDAVGSIQIPTFRELRAVAKLKANNWKIKKGQVYVKQFNKQDGQVYTFRTLPDILQICIKYNLYGDD